MILFRLWLISAIAAALLQAQPPGMTLPQYTEQGELIRPQTPETWMFVGASVGLSYATNAPQDGPGLIHNVYMQPEAYRHYLETGKFPEKTVMVLRLHKPEQKVSPSLHGYFEGQLVATEVAVKDSSRFPEGWAYFDFGGGPGLRASAAAKPAQSCHACHVKHAAKDNVFVQFYPALRDIKRVP